MFSNFGVIWNPKIRTAKGKKSLTLQHNHLFKKNAIICLEVCTYDNKTTIKGPVCKIKYILMAYF